MVPAYAATLLDKAGHRVVWNDAIAEESSYDQWLESVDRTAPDMIFMETKTPVVKTHWKMIDQIKQMNPETKLVLAGDHVSALPSESMKNSQVDFILTGGDYDFLLLNLVEYLDSRVKKLEPGIWFREKEGIESTGRFRLDHDLNSLPFMNRDLTKWKLYAYKNGNFKATPGTYLMVGRDCWWRRGGGCTFCAWPTLYPSYNVMSLERALDEVGFLVEQYRVKEIFDDTGTFPAGMWLKKFCEGMIKRGYNEETYFSCNARFGIFKPEDYQLMKKAGFRMLLFGLESASQKTLDRLNKGIVVQDIIDGCKWAREAGLEPHITIMVGYPWETREDVLETLKLAKKLMEKGWAITLQSTIVMPYPGTRLYEEALTNDWFRIEPEDYDRFDMTEPVLKTLDMEAKEVIEVCDSLYKIFLSPKYAMRHLSRVKSLRDLEFTVRGLKKVFGHVKDFK